MRGQSDQSRAGRGRDTAIWALVKRQHGVIARRQLLELGLSRRQIERRIASGRLHPVWRGVYAVGRPLLDRHGYWLAAVLACGAGAALSHGSAAELWGFGRERRGLIEVSVPACRRSRLRGIRVHRRTASVMRDVVVHEGIPRTSPLRTLIDEAAYLQPMQVERAVNEADKLDLVRADALRESLDGLRGQPGVRPLLKLLDPLTFRLSDSEPEQRMRPLAQAVGLPAPETKTWVNGYEVDFYWPQLGIVVEADGLRYHRTASQQRRGLERDQAHLAAGMWPLRFSHWQIEYDAPHVQKILRSALARAESDAKQSG
jgi:putative AbiEi antitoxin of type IV toxin-antitoxin system